MVLIKDYRQWCTEEEYAGVRRVAHAQDTRARARVWFSDMVHISVSTVNWHIPWTRMAGVALVPPTSWTPQHLVTRRCSGYTNSVGLRIYNFSAFYAWAPYCERIISITLILIVFLCVFTFVCVYVYEWYIHLMYVCRNFYHSYKHKSHAH